MFILKRAFLLGLAATLVAPRAHGHVPVHGHVLKRGLPEPVGNDRIPINIVLGDETWTRQEIIDAIGDSRNGPKNFINKGLENKGGRWVSKNGPLFEGAGSGLDEWDLTKSNNRGKYRAITTKKNKNFIGITEHVEQNNVRAFFDVKEQVRAGTFLNGGTIEERVTGTNGLHFSRKDIVASMESKTRQKVPNKDGQWRSKISPLGGSKKEDFNVVYKGNKFLYIEDASKLDKPLAERKIFSPPKVTNTDEAGPPCKRGAGTDCILGEETKPKGEETKQKGEETKPEGEETKPKGEETKPKGEASKDVERAKRAETVSKEKFEELAQKHKLNEIPKKIKPDMDLVEFRQKLNYKALEPSSPRLRPGSGGVAVKLFGAAGGALWVGGVLEAFTTDMSALNRAAILSAIVPFLGCTVNAVSSLEAGKSEVFNGIDTALCLIGDAFAVSGFIPGIVVAELARWIVTLFEPIPELPTIEDLQKSRDSVWLDKFIRQRVFKYIYAAVVPSDGENEFTSKLAIAFGTESLAVVSEGAQQIGALNASSSILDLSSELNQEELEVGAEKAIGQVTDAISAEIIRRQRNYLLGLPVSLKENSTAFLLAVGEDYNKGFTEMIQKPEHFQKYPNSWFEKNILPIAEAVAGGFAPVSPNDPYSNSKTFMANAAATLEKTPLPMPDLLEIAFILGQSKALTVSDEVLSVMAYLKEQLPGKSDEELQKVAGQQAFSVIKAIHGDIKESDLPQSPLIQDKSIRQGLQVLLAIHLGKVEDIRKRIVILGSGPYPTPEEVKWASLPLVPPANVDDNRAGLVASMLGLIDATTWWKYEKGGLSDEEKKQFASTLKEHQDTVLAYENF